MNSYITGAVIKRLREENGMTQSSLAEKLGVSDKTVSKWETGKGYPDITLVEDIAATLGVSLVELISGETVKNKNIGFNMKKGRFYICPVCANVIFASGEAVVCCHGITLQPETAEECDNSHKIKLVRTEDEYFITMDHEMSKSHYISFFAAISDNGINIIKLYPEGNCEARFKISRTYEIYAYCNRHGLFKVMPQTEDYSAEAKEKYGKTKEYKEYKEKFKDNNEIKQKVIADGLMWIFQKFGAIKDGSPESPKANELVLELKKYLSDNYYNCTTEILKSLGQMYVFDERFKNNIDNAAGEGTAEFVNRAISVFKE